MKLNNKVAIVTGASRGIGKCIAQNLAEEGTHLALIARSKKDLEVTAYACEQLGVTARIYPFDLLDFKNIPELVEQIKKDFKQVDILVNDAGRYVEADPFSPANMASWDETMDLNFKAVYHLTTEFIKYIQEQEAAVINISSISGLTITEGGEIYNASKAALKSYGGCLFEDVREKGIKVTNIYPGYVNTLMTEEDKLNHEKMIQPKDVADAVMAALKLSSTACLTDITIRPQFSPSNAA